jgi:hypothetical protein
MRNVPFFLHLSLLLSLGLLVAAHSKEPPVADCASDDSISTRGEDGDLWSALEGRISFEQEAGEPFVRLTFLADPKVLRFDRDASLRVRTSFACRPGERPLALEAEIRASATLTADNEFNDVILLGNTTRFLPGEGIRAPNVWQPIRILLPGDGEEFTVLHFGAGAGWAREHPGETIRLDLRRIRLLRGRPLVTGLNPADRGAARWAEPDDPEADDPGVLLVAPGAPVFAVVDVPGAESGTLRWKVPPGIRATVWQADWRMTEQKRGVVTLQPIRLLPYTGAHLDAVAGHPHRFWIRLAAVEPRSLEGEIRVSMGTASLRRPLRSLAVTIPRGESQFQMYYQINENWTGYAKYASFYRNVAGHFAQLADMGFTGVHLADEPRFADEGKGIAADFRTLGQYWQHWPLPLGEVLAAARSAEFRAPLAWEGLRIFTRDDVWTRVARKECPCEAKPVPVETVMKRLPELARASVTGWKSAAGAEPLFSIADEPGVHSAEEVRQLIPWLKAMRQAGFRNYLTTHARMYDSFHALAPWLDANVLHAEDVTAGARAFVHANGGKLWLYNGGSMNAGPPRADRFFMGLYGWLAGADGVTQWIYTRPSDLPDPLDLRTRLQDDAQFYALPGVGSRPAATPGLLALAQGIADRRLLDFADASTRPAVKVILRELRSGYPLPQDFDEYAIARLRSKADLAAMRKRLLLALQ